MGTSLLSNGMSLQNTATKTAQRHTMQQASCLEHSKIPKIALRNEIRVPPEASQLVAEGDGLKVLYTGH